MTQVLVVISTEQDLQHRRHPPPADRNMDAVSQLEGARASGAVQNAAYGIAPDDMGAMHTHEV